MSPSRRDGWVFTDAQLGFIRSSPYHYNAWSRSLVERHFFQALVTFNSKPWVLFFTLTCSSFWIRLVKLVPYEVPGTGLTLMGLSCSFLAACVTLWHSPYLSGPVPSWVFYFDAACVMLYHMFDGIDGKQAFKNQNSEIEECYDHGADSVTSVFQALLFATALQFPSYAPAQGYILFLLSLLAMFFTHFAADATHTVVFSEFDASEAQCVLAAVLVMTGYGGQDIWQQKIYIDSGANITLTPGAILIALTFAAMSRNIFDSAMTVFGGQRTPLESVGVTIPRRPYSRSALAQAAMVVICSTMAFLSRALSNDPALFVLGYGLAFAKVCVKMVVLSKARGEVHYVDLALRSTMFITAVYGLSSLYRHHALATCCLLLNTTVNVVDIIYFAVGATKDFEAARNIDAFKMPPQGKNVRRICDEGFYVSAYNLEHMQKKWAHFKASEPVLLRKLYG